MATDEQTVPPTPPTVRPRVYVETTVISRLTAWPSRDPDIAAEQVATREWWDLDRPSFDPCTSEHVRDEARAGDAQAAADRLAVLLPLPVLDLSNEIKTLARLLLQAKAFPVKATDDALHVAIATVWRIPFLLTWNMRHISNATMLPVIQRVCLEAGYVAPAICSPNALRGERS
ncbi:hypothetical protein BH11PLA2_BH11PLA2_09280 [soil metagenome]